MKCFSNIKTDSAAFNAYLFFAAIPVLLCIVPNPLKVFCVMILFSVGVLGFFIVFLALHYFWVMFFLCVRASIKLLVKLISLFH